MPSREELLTRTTKSTKDAMRLHPLYKGKVQMMPKCAVRDLSDFAIWYTPGVAAPCRAIQTDPALVYEHTNKANCIAIVSDGARVLGLGDIGPEAGLPVMEGKALLFKFLGGVDAAPLCLRTKDPDEFIRTVKFLAREVVARSGDRATTSRPSARSTLRTWPSRSASAFWIRCGPK